MFHPIIPPQRGYNTWQDMHSGHWMKLEFMSNSNLWPSSIALVLMEVTGLNPIEAMIFSGFLFPIAQIRKLFTAMIILCSHLQPQFKYELFHIDFTSFHFCRGKYQLNKSTSLSMCGFIAQLVEHCTGICGGQGFQSH